MTNQPPLLDPSGSGIPGPLFSARPGWGGRIARWLSHNASMAVFRLVILLALILIGRSIWIRLPARQSSFEPMASASPESRGDIVLVASRGDGMTTLAAHALDLYIATSNNLIRLTAAQHLFAVDTLARSAGWKALNVGQSVVFTRDALASVVSAAQALTPAQRAAWGKFLRQ